MSEDEPWRLDPATVEAMAAEVDEAAGVLKPSRFWEGFATRNAASLRDNGLASFKRSVNYNYFQWVINSPRQPEFASVLRAWLRHPSTAAFARPTGSPVDWSRPRSERQLPVRLRPYGHAVYVGMLWGLAGRRVPGEILARLDEPALGDPIAVRCRGRTVSEDRANSLLEYDAVAEFVPASRLRQATLLEIGAGYGRFADLLLSIHPDSRVVIVDIPPALALSQAYLTTRRPDRSAHLFTRDQSANDLADDIARSQMSFLTPNQLQTLPSLGADLVVNVSSLHEMLPVQVREYFRLIQHHAPGGHFYTKQWKSWYNPVDGVQTDAATYPYPPTWERLFERTPVAQPAFFEALFAV